MPAGLDGIVAYSLASTALVAAMTYPAYLARRHFYPTVIYLTSSKLSLLVLGNEALLLGLYAAAVAMGWGDGSAAACVTPVVSWFQSQSIFLRAGIAFVIACTIVAVVLIEYLAEEATSGDGFFLAEVGRATRLDASPPGALDA